MRLGIVGHSGSGKTTLFRALGGTREKVPHHPGSGSAVISVDVPDPRLDWLRELEKPKKYTPVRLEFADFPGIPLKEEKGKKELFASLREVDGLVILLRSFTDPSYPYEDAAANPVEEARSLHQEFLLSDYSILEARIERMETSTKKPSKTREQELRELALLKRLVDHIEKQGGNLDSVKLTHDEEMKIRGFRFLFQKPTLWIVNHGEGTSPEGQVGELRKEFANVDALSVRLEEEIASLDEEDRPAFLADFGISEPARLKLIHDAYKTLGLISFFTTGSDEVRAWTIKKGENALTAAGKIHSDLARGFIRAEVTPWQQLKDLKSWHEVKAKKKLRVEGKDYKVSDGDIFHVRFNV